MKLKKHKNEFNLNKISSKTSKRSPRYIFKFSNHYIQPNRFMKITGFYENNYYIIKYASEKIMLLQTHIRK